MECRDLELSDYSKNYLDLVNHFTKEKEEISYDNFKKVYDTIKSQNTVIKVVEDGGVLIGSITIFIEHKFHNNLSKIGHIEDVIVLEKYRGQGLGKLLIDEGMRVCKKEKCYKVVLSCYDRVKGFYEKCGFENKGGIELCKYL